MDRLYCALRLCCLPSLVSSHNLNANELELSYHLRFPVTYRLGSRHLHYKFLFSVAMPEPPAKSNATAVQSFNFIYRALGHQPWIKNYECYSCFIYGRYRFFAA